MSEIILNQNSILYAVYLQFVNLGQIAATKAVFEGRNPKVEDAKLERIVLYLDIWQQAASLTPDQQEDVLYAILKLAEPLTTSIMATLQPLLGNQIIYAEENPPISIVGLPYRVYAPRGYWSAAAGTFPTTGGTGVAGAIEAGNTWEINVEGTLGDQFVPAGGVIRALTDAPGQTAGNWHITSA